MTKIKKINKACASNSSIPNKQQNIYDDNTWLDYSPQRQWEIIEKAIVWPESHVPLINFPTRKDTRKTQAHKNVMFSQNDFSRKKWQGCLVTSRKHMHWESIDPFNDVPFSICTLVLAMATFQVLQHLRPKECCLQYSSPLTQLPQLPP